MSEFKHTLNNNNTKSSFTGKLETEIKIEIVDIKDEGLSEEDIFDDGTIPSVAVNDMGHLENDYHPFFSVNFSDIYENSYSETCIEFQCAKCLSDFSDAEKLAIHVKTIHGNSTPTLKGIDENNLKLLKIGVHDNLLQVSNSVPEEAVDQCNNCLLENKDKDLVESKSQKKVPCNRCKSELAPKKKLNHSSTSGKNLRNCSICSKSYEYKIWHAHMREIHRDGCFICHYCNKQFKVKRYLRKHINYTHRKNMKKPDRFECAACPKVFNNRQSLQLHTKNCHGKESQCTICGKKFKSILYLRTHMARVHYDDGKKHKCPICSKEFKAPRRVKMHIKNSHSKLHQQNPSQVRKVPNLTK